MQMKVHDLKPARGLAQGVASASVAASAARAARPPAAAPRARRPATPSRSASRAASCPSHSGCPKLRASTTRSGSSTRPSTSTRIEESGLDRGHPRGALRQGPRPQGRARQGPRPRRAHPRGHREGPRLLRSRPRPPSPPPAVRSRSLPAAVGRPCVRRPRATPTPTADHPGSPGRADRRSTHRRLRRSSERHVSRARNIFKVPDLRNKILFTLVHDRCSTGFGASHPGARHRPRRRSGDSANQARRGRRARLPRSCSPAARSRSSRSSRSGSCRTSRRRSSCRSSTVVIPKLEQWQQQGAVGQRKITQWTRYLTIGIAVLQSTGLVFLFHNGGGGLRRQHAPAASTWSPNFTAGPCAADRAHPRPPAPPC